MFHYQTLELSYENLINGTTLKLKEDSVIVDATLGYGGHSSNILDRIKEGYLFC